MPGLLGDWNRLDRILGGGLLSPEQRPNALQGLLAPQAGAGRGFINPATQPGNINLLKRPVVRNPDGSISTVRSMSVNFGNGEVLIPTVSDDGRMLTEDQAIELYKRTGKHLGMFNNPQSATEYAESLHNDQARIYKGR